MTYALVMVTHGDAPTLRMTENAFYRNVVRLPDKIIAVIDGPMSARPRQPRTGQLIEEHVHPEQLGFGAAMATGWQAAVESGCDYVFWLENDFALTRPVDIEQMAEVLEADYALAQIALMRNAVNESEKAAGGLFESRRDQYTMCADSAGHHWYEHTAYFTTNPSLMRRSFMEANPWPDDSEPHSEGRFGIDVVSYGYRFAAWGEGEPWCIHTGVRDGIGY